MMHLLFRMQVIWSGWSLGEQHRMIPTSMRNCASWRVCEPFMCWPCAIDAHDASNEVPPCGVLLQNIPPGCSSKPWREHFAMLHTVKQPNVQRRFLNAHAHLVFISCRRRLLHLCYLSFGMRCKVACGDNIISSGYHRPLAS